MKYFAVLLLAFLPACSLFSTDTEGEAFAESLAGLNIEYQGLAETFETISERSLPEDKKAEVLAKITESKLKFKVIHDKCRELLEKATDVDYDKLETLARLYALLGQSPPSSGGE